MGWSSDLFRAFGSGKTSWAEQLYNWKIPGKKSKYYPTGEASLKELYSPKGFEKGGKYQRGALISRGSAYGKGFLGITDKKEGGTGELKFWGDRYGDFKRWSEDPAGSTRDTIVGDFNLQDWLDDQVGRMKQGAAGIIPEKGLVQMPDISLEPIGEGMSDFAMALGMGLGSLGQGIGGGMPQMPSMPLMDEEGEPNILVLGGLAAVAYVVLKKVKT